MNTRILEKARTLLLVAVMVTAALTPMLAGANDEQLKETESVMYTVVSTSGDVYLDEGGMGWYEICLDEVPDGVVVITPTSDNSAVEIYPAYLKFSKLNWDECDYFDVEVSEDDDASDTMATISHAIDGTDTIFAMSTIADVMVEAYDMDYDMDGDDVPDYDDSDIDGDGVDNDDDAFPEDDEESLDTDGDGIGNNEDLDDDGDGYSDSDESTDCGDASDDLDDNDMPLDTDGDGICDELDSDDDDDMVNDTDDFAPLDDSEQYDTDGDGVGDNADVFPDDATETEDSDEDGVGDNSDFDNADADESVDSDGDGVGDNGDAFPDDSTETMDTDGDGVGDNADFAPEDASESADDDADGVGNNADAFPDDSTETMDTDGDGVGDNADTDADDDTVLDVDEDSNATLDCQLLTDCDGDGVGDADDAFDVDPEAWDDMDMDGLADSFPNLLVITEIGCSVSVGYADTDSDGDGYQDAECTFTLPAGGNMDLYVQTGNYGSETGVKLTLPDSTQMVWSHGYSTGFSSYTLYNLGAYDEPGDYTLHMYDSYGDSCNAGADGCFVLADAGTVLAMPSSSGFGTDLDMDDDGDSWDDTVEDLCGTDNMDATDVPLDTDSDLECDVVDDDDDGDGVLDSEEADGAGIGIEGADVDCTLVVDCDGDGVDDGTDSNDNDATETTDMDGDGIGDNSDSDVDGDGYGNANDAFPDDGTEWSDNDGDGVGDNSDLDDDDDGTEDEIDDFPFDANQQFDVDGDGWGNNADMDDDGDGIEDQVDEDDDGDGYSDVDEDTNCVGGNSLTDDVTPDDYDGDMSCDSLDADDDDDGTDDVNDAFPMDACADTDTDGDGLPDSLAADCETILSEDEDDDVAAPALTTWNLMISDSWSDGYHYIYVYNSAGALVCELFDGSSYNNANGASDECTIEEMYVDIEWDHDYYGHEGTLIISDEDGNVLDYYSGNTYSYDTVYLSLGNAGGVDWTDAEEADCGTDPLDSSEEPLDTDADEICDVLDDDNDNDGVLDSLDAFPFDSTESNDVDGDGIGDNADTDNDNDGTLDSDDAFPLDDCADTDTDGDGSPDTVCTANNFNAVGSDIASFGLDENGALTLTFSSPIETDGIGSDVVVIMEMWDDSTNSWENLDGTGLDNGGTHTTFTCNMEYWCDEYTGVELVRATLTNSGIDSIAYYDGSSGIGYLGESADDDDDNDGYSDEDETDNCGTASDPLDNTSMPLDTDMDMACDELDDDDDGDTVNDSDESIGCMLVTDCDGDGVGDADEGIVTGDDSDIASFGLSENGALTMIFSSPIETDGIGSDVVYYMDTWNEATNSWDNMIGVGLDNGDTHTIHSCNMEYWCEEYTGVELVRARLTSYGIDSIAYYNGSSGIGYLDDMHVDVDCTITVDCDGDTFDDLVDAFPLDASEWSDMDGDGFGDNDDDGDIDGDGLANAYDACPLDANEYYDTDGDGICDNADDDDDGDGVLDVDDVSPLDSDESSDWDGDGIGDNTDADDDGDGIDDDVDLDEDGESQAYDFDNDGWDDDDEVTCETNGTNSESIPSDNDDDGLCDDFQDDDDDNDGTVDTEDAFPLDADVYADNDGDGMADSSDVDTNNDYIITTESYSTLTVGVYDYDGNELCMLETDGAYNGAAGDQDSCEINAAGIEIVAIDVDYYTYFGAFYAGYGYSGYGSAVNINVTIGEDEYTYAADYGWVSATSGDSTMSTDEFYATTSAGTVMDEDDDNDGYSDLAETDNCGTASDSMDDASMPLDTDMDMICDELDDDDDDDGYSDADETTNCGTASDSLDNESTPLDTDMDMLCDELDEDDDNDGYSDADETTNCPSDPSDPLNSVDTTRDFDQDGLCDDLDSDDDGDGVDDVDDAFPYDWDATMDTDGDGLADDIDNMATGDWLFEIAYDADGGNNTFIITVSSFNWSLEPNPSDFDANIVDLCMTDTSDSNDSYADCMVDGDTDLVQVELQVIGEPEAYLSTTFPNGFVFESPLGDVIDDEGFATWWFSPITWWGTALDWDDDNDWFWDVEEEMYCVDDEHGATDSLDDTDMPLDTDMDMLCNGIDVDDDNDGYYDADDAFPVHASSYMDTDGDGMPDFMELVVGDMGDDFELGNFSGMDWNQRDAHPNWGWNDSYGEIFNCEDGQVISWFGQSFVPSYWINDGYVDCNDGSDESVDMDTFGPELTGWERSGDVNFGIGTGSFVDSYGVRGMGLDANESASLSITIETSDGFMTFDYAISSEERYDEMCLFVDGMEYGCMSGQEPKSTYLDENGDWLDFICETPGVYGEQISIDWVQDGWDDCGDSDGDGISDDEDASLSIWTYATGTMEIYVSEGIHTFEWQYSKDGDTDGGSDRVYLDNIRFPTMVEGDLDELTIDMDDDNDGVEDEMDGCPLDDTEQIDTDGDGFCNNQDSDDDGDGVYDYNDAMPLDANEQYDFDGDGIGDNTDTDNDNDGCENDVDDLPFDESSCDDFDGDGVGDEADMDDDGDNVLDAEDPFPFDGTAWLDNDGDGMPDFNGPPQFAGDFEGGSISAPWDTYGDADWTVVDSTTSLTGAIINGTFSAQSGDISDSQTSSLAVEFSTIAGDLSFEYVTSTENNWDYLRFYVDGILQASWSGSTSGVHVQSITAGTHTFEFQFYKDGSVSSGDDTVWVDDLVLPLAQIANTNNDTDDDNDGTMDDYDLDPLNPCVALDTDGDGLPDSVESGMFDMSGTGDEDYWVDCDASGYYADSDDDGDDWSDEDEMICGSDSLDNNSTPDDFDNDWLCDLLDNDSDNDGIEDSLDSFPYDSTESEDYDGDGIGDNADSDDDNDNVSDVDDAFPYDANESADLDGDGQGDNADNDTDGDGVPNDVDSFPTDDGASTDTDGDGIDDEADTDDDGDGVPDVVDWAPLDSAESVDSDGDGLGDNADTDDDNDSVEDGIDAFPLDSSEYADYDGDGVGDNADIDDDNDGIPDGVDLFPNDATESRDLDEDGLGDNSDSDRDGDGVANADDIFPDNAAETVDLDMDGIGDNSDVDDDGDGDLDEFDSFPTDSAEWDDTDADGIGNNADDDDDGDGALDIVEDRCGSDSENANSVPSDYDLDGICDAEDSEVSNSDTLEEQDELGWSNAVPGFPAIFAGIALVGAALIGRRNDD